MNKVSCLAKAHGLELDCPFKQVCGSYVRDLQIRILSKGQTGSIELVVFLRDLLPFAWTLLKVAIPEVDYKLSFECVDENCITRDNPVIIPSNESYYAYYIVPEKKFKISIDPVNTIIVVNGVSYNCTLDTSNIVFQGTTIVDDYTFHLAYHCKVVNSTRVVFESKIINPIPEISSTNVGKFKINDTVYAFSLDQNFKPGTVQNIELLNTTLTVDSQVVILKAIKWELLT